MTIPRYRVEYEMYLTHDNVKGDLVDLKDLVKYLHEQIHISDTNRKAYEEECRILDRESDSYKWQFVEAMKSEAEMNAFILVLQALGKNPIKESKCNIV